MVRFIDALGRCLAKPRLRELCQELELTELETRLLFARCVDGLNIDQIADLHNLPLRVQRCMVPLLNDKVLLHALQNRDFLTYREKCAIDKYLSKYNRLPEPFKKRSKNVKNKIVCALNFS